MILVPTAGLVGAIEKAAAVDPGAADTLVRLGLYEAMTELVETHRGEIEPVMLVNMEKRLGLARARLLRQSVGKSLSGEDQADLEATAEYLGVLDEWVSKGLSGALLSLFNRQHPRDDKGRFVTANVSSGSPENPPESRANSSKHNATMQVDRWIEAGMINPNTKFRVFGRVQDENGRRGDTLRHTDTDRQNMDKDLAAFGPDVEVTGISIDRRHVNKPKGGQGAVDMMRTFTGADELTARRLAGSLPLTDDGKVKDQSLNAERWYGASNGTDRKGYRQLSMVGRALQSASEYGSPGHSVGTIAQLVGEMGPEAEKVLGPSIRRTAYRYRGTERRPDREVVRGVASAENAANAINAGVEPPAPSRGQEYLYGVVQHYGSKSLSDDERTLKIRGDVAVGYLLGAGGGGSHLANRQLTALSLATGEVPPSEGILIDANGHVHSQAVGYNGDHYLPFDLKNLNALFGGQYVRTRAAGGPSTEDLYTGLLTGARQIQVVSNSGVFTFEFDPDLRGGRRYSDKAARMVQRYGEILDAIATEKLYQDDVPAARQSALRRQAAEQSDTPEEFQTRFERLMEQERMKGSVADVDDEELDEGAEYFARTKVAEEMQRRGRLTPTQRADRMQAYRQEFYENNGGATVRRMRLDGPGYDRAMKALKQEFPYFLRNAEWQSLPDWMRSRGLRPTPDMRVHVPVDRGHVKRGQTNAYLPGHTDRSRSLAARREVPSGVYGRRPSGGETVEIGTTQTEAAAQGGATTARAAAAPATAQKTPEQILAAMKQPGSTFERAVHNAFRGGLGYLLEGGSEPAGGPIEDLGDASKAPHEDSWLGAQKADDFVHLLGRRFRDKEGPRAPSAFAHWFVNASPAEQQKVLDSREGMLEKLEVRNVPGISQESINRSYDQLEKLVTVLHPFAPKDLTWKDTPDWDDPRALEDPDFPVGQPAEWYAKQAKNFETDEPATFRALQEIGDAKDEDVVGMLMAQHEKLDSSDPQRAEDAAKRLQALNRAWSFRTAQRTSAAIAQFAGGGAAPKAPTERSSGDVQKGRPRRVLLFHTPSSASVVKSHRLPSR